MTSRSIRFTVSILALLTATFLVAAETPSKSDQSQALTAHEWGTFTSIAGKNGQAVEWLPYGGPSDLPCFVDRFKSATAKVNLSATVRMETPVIYFYSPRAMTLSVRVHFRQGLLTEWFPQAQASNEIPTNTLFWSKVKIKPDAVADFPVEKTPSHYYAARSTDAAPLEVGSQKERFLFYRGIGHSSVPIAATITGDGRVRVRNTGNDEIRGIILFENRHGQIGFRLQKVLRDEVTLETPSLTSDFATLAGQLEEILVAEGLYRKEAEAMIETWRDSWFEQGARLFYLVPQRAIDSILPLEIQPAPAQIARVFVGRTEIITPATEREVRDAIANDDRVTLEQYGRFLEPISNQLGVSSGLTQSIRSSYLTRASVCH
jgi:hypothetical protein